MAQVSVTINGRNYPILCDDGQEEHVSRLAAYIDKRASEIAETVGQVGESRLLVMASLLVADELSEAYARLEAGPDGSENGESAESVENAEEILAAATESLARRIETIAERMEGA